MKNGALNDSFRSKLRQEVCVGQVQGLADLLGEVISVARLELVGEVELWLLIGFLVIQAMDLVSLIALALEDGT